MPLNGVYPFGGQSFLTEDLCFQYADFYAWMLRVFRGEASLLYNPYTGMGTNAWGIFSYYLSSPLILLLPLFGERHIVAFVWCTTAAKLGLAGVSMGWYLRRRFCLARPQAVALALCYAFSTWTQTQMRNPQWLDALVLTPLAAYALFLLIQRKRWLPLAFVAAATIVCCWYTAYMLLAFLFLLFVLELLAWSHAEKPEHALRAVLQRGGLLAASLALGLG